MEYKEAEKYYDTHHTPSQNKLHNGVECITMKEHLKLSTEFNTELLKQFNELKDNLKVVKEQRDELLKLSKPPKSLTYENEAKMLLMGEFVECFDPEETGNPYIVPISWTSIKLIYDKIVNHFSNQ